MYPSCRGILESEDQSRITAHMDLLRKLIPAIIEQLGAQQKA